MGFYSINLVYYQDAQNYKTTIDMQ